MPIPTIPTRAEQKLLLWSIPDSNQGPWSFGRASYQRCYTHLEMKRYIRYLNPFQLNLNFFRKNMCLEGLLHCSLNEYHLQAIFPSHPTPTSHYEHQFYGVTSGFSRFIVETKYACHPLISPYVNFDNNPTI